MNDQSMGLDGLQDRLRLIRDSAADLLPRADGAKRARALRFMQPGFDVQVWKDMCGLGWSGLRVPEQRGGTGLDVSALCAIAEELGAALSPEPFICSAVAAPLLPDSSIGGVLTGERIVVPAWQERPSGLDVVGGSRFRAGRVSGTKRFVPLGDSAHAFLVTTGDGLALVDRDAAGVTIQSHSTRDGSTVADIHFDAAPALAVDGGFEEAFEEAALATGAYLLGAMETAFDLTLAYLRTRKQFGKPIGSFQAIRHRAVDMKIHIELTRAVVYDAARTIDSGQDDERRRAAVSRAKARAADSAMAVVRESVQFHGAMGIADECDIGLYCRKILSHCSDFGSATDHRERFTRIDQRLHDGEDQ